MMGSYKANIKYIIFVDFNYEPSKMLVKKI